MSPEARRAQIIDVARDLMTGPASFSVSTADVAEAAGVTRALVHHYFRGIDELRQAVAFDLVRVAPEALHSDPGRPVAARVAQNLGVFLDLVWANRHIWLATVEEGERHDAGAVAVAAELRSGLAERIIANNRELIDDTRWARVCLDGYLGFSNAICRRWIEGDIQRPSVERALAETLLHLLLVTIPQGSVG